MTDSNQTAPQSDDEVSKTFNVKDYGAIDDNMDLLISFSKAMSEHGIDVSVIGDILLELTTKNNSYRKTPDEALKFTIDTDELGNDYIQFFDRESNRIHGDKEIVYFLYKQCQLLASEVAKVREARINGFKDAQIACSFNEDCKFCEANRLTLAYLGEPAALRKEK
jgi:hypothetical protein